MNRFIPFFSAVLISCLLVSNQSFSRCDNTPGLADSHVLALSWQSGFCETYGARAGKAECQGNRQKEYSANHLALHGLWPNQKACGIRYGFCGGKKKRRFCSYPPLSLSEDVSKSLGKYMPSYKEGGCLERHEWNKHGLCQALSQDNYFSLAIRLNQEFNQSKAAQLISSHAGRTIKVDDFMDAFIEDYGVKAANNVHLSCSNGQLVEIWLTLPALIPESYSLTELLNQTEQDSGRQGCPSTFEISDFLMQ